MVNWSQRVVRATSKTSFFCALFCIFQPSNMLGKAPGNIASYLGSQSGICQEREMAKVKLWCAVYGEGSVFSVVIERDAKVETLQKAIENKMNFNNRFNVGPAMLTLYLVRKKEGERIKWMKDVKNLDALLRGDVRKQFLKMHSWWRLDDEEYFGSDFTPEDEEIHVLVELPHLTPTMLPREPPIVVDGVYFERGRLSVNPPALAAFWEACRNNRTNIKADGLIELPEDTYILGNEALGSRIYIRRCYPKLWELCQQWIHDEDYHHFLILGNPGIGKTYFSFFILLLLARAGATVVCESGIYNKRFLFSCDVVIEGSQEDFIGVLHQSTTYYIVDAVKPPYYEAKSILLTWPLLRIWNRFFKRSCRLSYIPVWSLEEILKCRELMYSGTPEAVVKDCFRRWGGIPSYVLRFAQVGSQQVLLDTALNTVDLDWLMNIWCNLDQDGTQVTHRLLHYCVNEQFLYDHIAFASKYVQQEIYNRLYVQDKQKFLKFIAASGANGPLAGFSDRLPKSKCTRCCSVVESFECSA